MPTSAGIAAGLDCCLHLLARWSGTGETNRIARHLVSAPADHRVSELLESIRTDPCTPPPLDEIARRAGMSRRSVVRHIRDRTGGSLGDWLKRARLARAQDLLAGGARGLEDIALKSGFPDAHALRAAFRTELGLTPTHWLARQRLGQPSSGL